MSFSWQKEEGEIAELFLPVGAVAALILLAKPDVSGDEDA